MNCFHKLVKLARNDNVADAETSLAWILQGLSVLMRSAAARAVLKRAMLSAPHPPAGRVVAKSIVGPD